MRSVCTEPLRHQTTSQINSCDPGVKPSGAKIEHLMYVCFWFVFFCLNPSPKQLLDPECWIHKLVPKRDVSVFKGEQTY